MGHAGEAGWNGGFARPGPLTVAVEELGSTLLLRLTGELDLSTVGQAMVALDRVDADRTTLVVFDLQDLTFLDLAGLKTILRANEDCQGQGIRVRVIKPRGLASRVFSLTRAHLSLDLVDSRAALHADTA